MGTLLGIYSFLKVYFLFFNRISIFSFPLVKGRLLLLLFYEARELVSGAVCLTSLSLGVPIVSKLV